MYIYSRSYNNRLFDFSDFRTVQMFEHDISLYVRQPVYPYIIFEIDIYIFNAGMIYIQNIFPKKVYSQVQLGVPRLCQLFVRLSVWLYSINRCAYYTINM